MNPYAAQLAGRDPMQVLPQSPAALETALAVIGPGRLDTPLAPGKWSPRQIACHLADCEIAFGFRLRQAHAQENHLVQPFDQDLWAKPYAGPAYSAEAAMRTYRAVRTWNLAFLSSLSPADLAKPMRHPERGEMPLREVVETMAGHDLNHLQQLARIS